MRIKNPNYLSAEQARLEKYGAIIDAYIATLPSTLEYLDMNAVITDVLALPEIVAAGLTEADVTQAKIANICAHKGIMVEP